MLAYGDESEPSLLGYELIEVKRSAPSNAAWRVAEHAAAIGRLYAVYEHFVEELLAKWLLMRTQGITYATMPSEFRAAYEPLFASMLQRAGEGRYDHLSYEAMIADQAVAYSGVDEWRIYPECLIHHDRNLRFETLNEIASRCGVSDLSNWVSRSASLATYFGDRSSLLERTQKTLKEIIQYRNEAAHAHTSIDETVGLEQFLQYVDFMEALCRSFYERVSWLSVESLQLKQRCRSIGRVTEVYTPGTRVVVIVEGITVRVGDSFILRSESSCFIRSVVSIQDNGSAIDQIVVANSKEVGLGFDKPVRVNDQVFVAQV
ncbi:hypothetical protein IFJ75_14100 [Brevundimonas goettingensis]|uniref:RiboL-PSP-HEPN domain-containing protein n=1 Tax=Brevundimonas goettingensis TaxID=2774190 RepID=A0A975GUN1_9CAUL|nr:hypothetical protein IFJ75_14100 [Brevundimonas goettingensis]